MGNKIYEIICETRKIIGDVAIVQANKVPGLKVNKHVELHGNPQEIQMKLIERYRSIIGPVADTIAKKCLEG
ncbi:MAG: hypothetical protein J7K22_01825 [Nanoarchaeota archaeon]|nr:hypothetical protein [Nanoarchaeota archaeon]